MTPSLQLKLFGSPQISYQGQPLTGFVSAKVRALLIYLAVTNRPHSRDHLAELFWADTPASTRTNLRKALSNLRQLIGDILVEDGKESIAVRGEQVWVDAVKFGQLSKQSSEQEATDLYQADFLTGFNLSLSYEFEAWALGEQSRLKAQMVDLLRSLATQHESRGTLPQAIQAIRRLLQLEPWHEEAHRWLMMLLAKDGQRSAALAHFEVCKRVLQEELAAPPGQETLALVAQLQQPLPPGQTALTVPTVSHYAANGTSRNQSPLPQGHATINQRPLAHSHLPPSLTPLLGRAHEQQRIAELLSQAPGRLVTLIGPPGIGKTRLGLAVAEQLQATLTDGVYFVPLAAIQEAELVVSTLIVALRLTADSQQTPLETVKEFLRPKASLVVLDNFEQLLAAGPLLGELLTACPSLRLLVTSRERLHLYGEQLYRVPPLALSAAVALFVQRVQALDVDFTLTPANEPLLQEICQQVDCLPLAIELSAALIELLPLPALLTQIREQRLALLQNGPRDLPDRQRTLRNAIQSSYRLLTEREQRLFRTLGICVGGFDQEVVESFGFDAPTLQSLIHKSLVQVSAASSHIRRFLLLETLREYALEQLAGEGENGAVAQQHAEIYLALAEEAATYFRGSDQAYWLGRLAEEHDNFRAALHWAWTNQATTIGVRLGIALRGFWYTRGFYAEGWQWLERLLAQVDEPKSRAKLLYARGRYARRMGNNDEAITSFSQSLTLFRHLADVEGIASSLRGLGMIHFLRGEMAIARPLFEEALPLFRQLDDQEGIAAALDGLGYTAESATQSISFYQESLLIRRRAGNILGVAVSLNHLAQVALGNGDLVAARSYQQEYSQLNRELGNQNGIANAIEVAGAIALAEGDLTQAQALFESCIDMCQKTGDNSLPGVFRLLGITAFKLGDYERAQRLIKHSLTYHRSADSTYGGILEAGYLACVAIFQGYARGGLYLLAGVIGPEESLAEFNWLERREFGLAVAEAHRQLNEADAIQTWTAGRAMTITQVIDYALTSSYQVIEIGEQKP